MKKSEFLAELRTDVCSAAEAILAITGQTTEGCPYLDYWFDYYGKQDSQHIERAIQKYSAEAASVTTARDYIPIITSRVRRGVVAWVITGELSEIPEGVPMELPGAGSTPTPAAAAPAAPETGSVQFKSRSGGPKAAGSPQAIQAQLGGGRSLEGSVRSRMESAFGTSFSAVRVHTDGGAAKVSDGLNARAFTVGEHVAFGSGEYQPGTLTGDAIIAHEMAHVVQQRGAGPSVATAAIGDTGYNALEEDADLSAVGAMASLWGKTKGSMVNVAGNTIPRLRSGLRLSRCKDTGSSTTKAASSPKKTVSVHINHLEKAPTSHAADLTKAQATYAVANVDIKEVKSAVFDDATTKSLIGNDYILDEYTSVGTPTAEEAKLLSEAAGRSGGAISVYYVKGLSHGNTGESFWPKDWANVGASVVISSTDTKETFSHELGHVLLDDGGHHADNNNLMFQPNFKFDLDATQRQTIYNSPFSK